MASAPTAEKQDQQQPNLESAEDEQQQNNQLQTQNEQQNGEDGDGSEDEPDIPAVQEPNLDRKGQISQRTVEQKHKQEELVKADKRLKGLDSNRSRSSSRRARRKRVQRDQTDGKFMHTNKLEALEEADANGENKAMGPFERIGPDSTSMDGPVTMARAERGEIPMRGTNPGQPYYNKAPEQDKGKLAETDGLKLTLEANLDIEIELKASIRGDLTLSLFA